MRFKEAILKAMSGEKIRKAGWHEYLYLYYKHMDGILRHQNDNIVINELLVNYIALDKHCWEIYEEEDNWNISDKYGLDRPNNHYADITRADVKKLKRKILDDLLSSLNDTNPRAYKEVSIVLEKRFGF